MNILLPLNFIKTLKNASSNSDPYRSVPTGHDSSIVFLSAVTDPVPPTISVGPPSSLSPGIVLCVVSIFLYFGSISVHASRACSSVCCFLCHLVYTLVDGLPTLVLTIFWHLLNTGVLCGTILVPA